MSFDVGQILSTVSEWGTFFLSWVSGVAAVVSGIVAYRVYRSQTSPDVIVYVESDSEGSEMAALFVENIGNAPAFDISLSASGKIPTGDECMRETLRRFILLDEGQRTLRVRFVDGRREPCIHLLAAGG